MVSGRGNGSRRAWLAGVAVALVACKADPPQGALAAIPADAVGAASVDVGAVLAFPPVERDRARLLGALSDGLLAAAKSCDVQLHTGRVTAAWSESATTLIVSASRAGVPAALQCLATHEALTDSDLRIDASGDPMQVRYRGESWTASAPDDDTLVLRHGAAAAEGGASLLAAELGRVDYGQPIWAASVEAEGTPWQRIVGDAGAFAMSASLDDDAVEISVDGPGRAGDHEARAQSIRDALVASLAEAYLPVSIAERVDVSCDEASVAVRVELHAAELYALDLRFSGDEPTTPSSQPQGRSAEVSALLASWAATTPPPAEMSLEPELLAGRFEPVGVDECDQYVRWFAECIDEKLPEAARETSLKALETSVTAWRRVATTEAGKEGLVVACRSASEAMQATCT
ncbi:MAG: hypothetical protein AAF721_30980 [Myxococcota bacterium]